MRGKVIIIGPGEDLEGMKALIEEKGLSPRDVYTIADVARKCGLSLQQVADGLAATVRGQTTKEMMENLKQSVAMMEKQHYAIVQQKRPRTQKKGVDHKAYKYHKFNKGKL